jgi:hypothetical protein
MNDNELNEFQADLAQRMVNRARQTSKILNLQIEGLVPGQDDVDGWVPGQSGSDPDSDSSVNPKNAARGKGNGPNDLRAILSQLDDIYIKIASGMSALRNHVEKARPNPSGSTPKRPFPDTGSRGTQNAFDARSETLSLSDKLAEMRRDLNHLRK